MSVFSKRREDDMEIPKSAGAPQRMAAQPIQTPAAFAAVPAPQNVPAAVQSSTSIGRTVTIKGEVRTEEDLVIDGQLEGKLDLGRHRLVVGPNGTVRAAIVAKEVDVHGAVNGNVEAAEKIILRRNAKLVGDLKMASVVIEDGAYFKGNIEITRPQEAQPPAAAVAGKPSTA